MRLRQCVYVRRDIGKAESAITAMKISGIRRVLEEPSSGDHVEGCLGRAPIDEEPKWENGFGVGGEDTGREEGEVGVTCDRILNTVPTDLRKGVSFLLKKGSV